MLMARCIHTSLIMFTVISYSKLFLLLLYALSYVTPSHVSHYQFLSTKQIINRFGYLFPGISSSVGGGWLSTKMTD